MASPLEWRPWRCQSLAWAAGSAARVIAATDADKIVVLQILFMAVSFVAVGSLEWGGPLSMKTNSDAWLNGGRTGWLRCLRKRGARRLHTLLATDEPAGSMTGG